MTGFDRTQTPKTRPMTKRTALVASLDIGTSKIACMIARLKPCPPSDALRGRSRAVELIGYSQIQSRGVKAGAVVDLAECEQTVRQAVALAERMARVRVESVLLSVSGGRLTGQLIEAASDLHGAAVTAALQDIQMGQLAQQKRRQRRKRRGLEDDAIPRRKGGSHLPARDREGKIPRRNDDSNAARPPLRKIAFPLDMLRALGHAQHSHRARCVAGLLRTGQSGV